MNLRPISLLLVALLLTDPGVAAAQSTPPQTLGAAVLSGVDPNTIDKIIVTRISERLMRIALPTPKTFESGEPWGDSEAISNDTSLIADVVDKLNATRIFTVGSCADAYPKLPSQLYVKWGLFLYQSQDGHEKEVARVFLGQDGLCASTGKQLYAVDPHALQTYLMRTFAFMNF